MIRIGIIGMGNMGRFHTNLIRQGIPGCRLAAVCDDDPERLEPFQEDSLKTFSSSSELIRSGEVDAVIVATPHYSHTTIGIDALSSGLHVLMEKPISVHKADCERLLAGHKDSSLVFAAVFNMRTDPHFIRIKRMIDSGDLGTIQRISWIITEWFRTEAYYSSGGWRATWKGEGGGVLLNQCPHNLDLWQWFFGMPTSLRAFCSMGKYHNIEVEDEVTAYMEFEGGATGVFVASTGEAPGTNRLEITGDNGKLVYEQGRISFTRNEIPTSTFSRTTEELFGKPPVWNVEIPVDGAGEQHAGIIRNFIEAICSGAGLIAPAKEGIHSVELANAMIYSSLKDETVHFPLDAGKYDELLKQLISESKFEKETGKTGGGDMEKSFQK